MTEEIISRKDARAQGRSNYFTGAPCRAGHISARAASNGNCLECSRLKQAMRYRDDPEKHRASTRDSYARNQPEIRARRKAEYDAAPEKGRAAAKASRQRLCPKVAKERRKNQYEKNREANLEAARLYRLANPDKIREALRAYYQTEQGKEARRLWRSANKGSSNQRERERRSANPEPRRAAYRKWADKEESAAVIIANAHRRRARLLAAPGKHTAADLAEIFTAQKGRCAYCRADLTVVKKHLDHITPLAGGGTNARSNLQFLCRPCNMTKSARDPIAFAQTLGLLL